MNYYQQIFTIGTFALYTFIFSLFIIPTLKNLSQIQDNFKRIMKPPSLLSLGKRDEDEKETEQQKKQFIDILKGYKLEYQKLTKLRNCVIFGAIITCIAVLILFFVVNPKLNLGLITLALYIILIVILMVWAFKTYIPNPQKITDWSYLVEHFSLSPSRLARCAELRADLADQNEKKRVLKIFSNIELRGYKYWFFIYDTEINKHIFISAGTIKNKINLKEQFPDFGDFDEWYANICELDIKKDKKFKIYFFVFDPVFFENYGCPYWGYNEITFETMVGYSSSYKVLLQHYPFLQIKYRGNNLKFKEITWIEKDIAEYTEHATIIKTALESSKKYLLKNSSPLTILNEL